MTDNPTTAALRALAAQDPTVTQFHVVTLTDDGIPSALGTDAEDHTRKIFEKWSKSS